ncbi:electron transfer flavoprotein subunit beta/FixA family protein [uncultured Pseudoramibacter sp.]|uniref:electron transfer flavoprotein subunit beta/FixA family protein n=1 Tax=uncultured Pseudoramibacter sp. TaxID=1623493 RepID=UPI0025D99E55|nr:electron transfer flavoprotein subunit beta/FixA family protein [uncultured Pseudoramibacter sp.]
MKIAICVKYVPVDSKVQVDPAIHALLRGSGAGEINPSDRYAVEMARRLKKDGDTLDVFTMGPADAVRALKVVLALGADHAYLLNDKAFAGSDTLGTAKVLAAALTQYGPYDVVLMGSASNDGATGQVGPMLAQMLGVPDVTNAVEAETDGKTVVLKKKDGNTLYTLKTALPALASVPFGANTPELPTLRHQVAANQREFDTVSAADLGLDPDTLGQAGAKSIVTDTVNVTAQKQGLEFIGSVDEKARDFADTVDEIQQAIGGGKHA